MRYFSDRISLILFCVFSSSLLFAEDLFFFQIQANQCLWQVYDAKQDMISLIHKTDMCPNPKLVLFDSNQKLVTYKLGEQIFSLDIKTKTVSPLGSSPSNLREEALCLSQETGRIRKAYILDGSEPIVAVVEEMMASSSWRELRRIETSDDDYGSGLSIVDDLMISAPGTFSLHELLLKNTYVYSDQIEKENLSIDKTILDTAQTRLKFNPEEYEEMGCLPLNNSIGILFKAVYGDTPHAFLPLLMFAKEGSRLSEIKYKPAVFDQVGLSKREEFLLVASEYSGENPSVYQAGSTLPVFAPENARNAVWLPFAFK